jgi:hypothetical protein
VIRTQPKETRRLVRGNPRADAGGESQCSEGRDESAVRCRVNSILSKVRPIHT